MPNVYVPNSDGDSIWDQTNQAAGNIPFVQVETITPVMPPSPDAGYDALFDDVDNLDPDDWA